MVYLFIGEDVPSKDAQLAALRKQVLEKQTEQFNLDILYGRETAVKDLQERLIYLPAGNSRRLLVIKEAQELKEDAKDFLLQFVQKPHKHTLLVLDVSRPGKSQEFLSRLQKYAKTVRFKETRQPDAFALNRWIELKKPAEALRLLSVLLKNGERPEKILGGLRYAWERETGQAGEMKKKLRMLLNCDIDIKTGRLKPSFALEKLVIGLCFGKPLH
jgi:DNA polymerase III delta subunit